MLKEDSEPRASTSLNATQATRNFVFIVSPAELKTNILDTSLQLLMTQDFQTLQQNSLARRLRV
jgi:hypothetical protein